MQSADMEPQTRPQADATPAPQTTSTPMAPTTTTTTTTTTNNNNNNSEDQDGFVVIEQDTEFQYEKNRPSYFAQMETVLARQVEKCDYYKNYYEQQDNVTMANKFASYSLTTVKNLDSLRASWRNNDLLPGYKYEHINLNCLPINVDVKDKELQIVVRTTKLPIAESAQVYAIGEFDFPGAAKNDSTVLDSWSRRLHYAKIDPNQMFCCSAIESRQLDIIYSTNCTSFLTNNTQQPSTEFDRPMSFFVDKGKSRTLKRKFKPIKLTLFEKTGLLRLDKRIGSVQIRIDAINDHSTISSRHQICNNRKQTDAAVEIQVRIREPLVDKTARAHEERLLILN